jgi:hypothetical protein
MTSRNTLGHLKTIPCSNLPHRKNSVLEIHKENRRMVQKLAQVKPDIQSGFES